MFLKLFQEFCRIFLSERKMSTLNFRVSTLEYDDIFIKRTQINGLDAWLEVCEYAEYEEIDQNSEKNIFSLNEYLSEKEY